MPRMQPVESTSVEAVGFDAARNELWLRYVGGDTYVYAMVPRSVVDALFAADSIGAFVNQHVKPRYPVRDAP